MVITLANQKGGVGKTTFIVLFANYLNEIKNKKVLVIDTDVQANASLSLENTNCICETIEIFKNDSDILADKILKKICSNKINLMSSSHNLLDEEDFNNEYFMNNIQLLKKEFDYILIDTNPVINEKMISSLKISDYVITPIELEVYSIQGLELMLNAIFNIKEEFNNSMNFLGVLPSRVNTQNKRQLKNLENLKNDFGEDLFLPFIKNRNDIANSIATKESIFSSKSKHKKEVETVLNFINDKIGV